ncbi:hypothetical protein [Bradyrhizobium sp. Tv2a-2]|uniref:hypothetical protein n=1 Tax=Bradyrhizobium sp. Tv2a-2 TaxID=113395 RepID=UPI0004637111|nr:hypothetical protein [Bradyrhizobium sp. Tv2a-2]
MARARPDDDDDDDIPPRVGRPRSPREPSPPEPHDRPEFASRLQVILDAIEIGDLPKDVRLHLQMVLRRCDLFRTIDAKRFPEKGEEKVTLLLRTIAESTNGPTALTEPILRSVSSCMKPSWVDRGLEWIEAFDSVDLVGLQATLADLGIEDQLTRVLRRKLLEILGPPVAPKPKPQKPTTKMSRPKCVSEPAWNEYVALREKLKRPKARIAALTHNACAKGGCRPLRRIPVR